MGQPASAGLESTTPNSFYSPDSSGPSTSPPASDPLPAPTNLELPTPMSATQIPSAEFQFGVAGRNEQVRSLVAEGRLRRLPVVAPSSTAAAAERPTARPFRR